MLKLFCVLSCCCLLQYVLNADISKNTFKTPTVVFALLGRNKAHILPYSLSLIQNLEYPKDRISLWIRSDHNIDNTAEILNAWLESVRHKYHSVNAELNDDDTSFSDEHDPYHWSSGRFEHVIRLREEALAYARHIWADYILFIDADALLTESSTLTSLVDKGMVIVAPMLQSDGLYSNFWAGMTPDGYYERTADYEPLLKRERVGCWPVPMVHTCVLVSLRASASDALTFVPTVDDPYDDIIAFARAANRSGVPMHICNDMTYGHVTAPLERGDSRNLDRQRLQNARMAMLEERDELSPVAQVLGQFVPPQSRDTLGFDRIFMINLRRRPERRTRMQHCFDVLGLQVDILDAVDGRSLNESALADISFMPDYTDPYHKRPMKLGEIGCFLSHYAVWVEVAAQGYRNVLVLEDDVRFEPFFRARAERLVRELITVAGWDLVYLGRKRMPRTRRPRNRAAADTTDVEYEDVYYEEPWVDGSDMLVRAGYSYWTLGYAMSAAGARKLLDAQPLANLLPVDEFLPIMYDRHPRNDWTRYYPRRDLFALSAVPLLIYPTHYTGDTGYISDTEDSTTVIPEYAHSPSAALESASATREDL